MQDMLSKINDLEQILKINPNNSEAKLELKRLKTELEDRQSLIFTDEPEPPKPDKSESGELSLKTAQKIGTDMVYFFSEKLNERFKWDKATQMVVFDKGQTYSEEEIRYLHQYTPLGDLLLKCVHKIKTVFPQTRWVGGGVSIECEQENTEEDDDEINDLFKDLKI